MEERRNEILNRDAEWWNNRCTELAKENLNLISRANNLDRLLDEWRGKCMKESARRKALEEQLDNYIKHVVNAIGDKEYLALKEEVRTLKARLADIENQKTQNKKQIIKQ